MVLIKKMSVSLNYMLFMKVLHQSMELPKFALCKCLTYLRTEVVYYNLHDKGSLERLQPKIRPINKWTRPCGKKLLPGIWYSNYLNPEITSSIVNDESYGEYAHFYFSSQ